MHMVQFPPFSRFTPVMTGLQKIRCTDLAVFCVVSVCCPKSVRDAMADRSQGGAA